MTSQRRRAQREGFTLMEVLLVLVILVILGSMAGIFIRGAQKKARADAARAQIGLFENAITMYEMHVQSYPASAQGLEALVQPTGDTSNWAGPYLNKQVPLDPWSNPYQYELMNPDAYRIWSFGPDGVDGSDDDVSNQF